jgi:hypothetical protein
VSLLDTLTSMPISSSVSLSSTLSRVFYSTFIIIRIILPLEPFPISLLSSVSLSLSDNRDTGRERRRKRHSKCHFSYSLSGSSVFFEKDKRFLHGRRQCQQHAIPLSSFPSLAESLIRPPTFVKNRLSRSFFCLSRSLACFNFVQCAMNN